MSMTKLLRVAIVLLALLAAFSGGAWADPPPHRLDSICAVVRNPKRYANREVEVRGVVHYIVGDATPPPIITDHCKWGIPLIGIDSSGLGESKGYKALMRAVHKPKRSGGPRERIWVTVHGTIRTSGDTFHMDVASVTDVVVVPDPGRKSQ